jgi:predicted RND superfamily exporter protein
MIELIMSVGFCIDFSAHITYAFIADAGQGSRSHRAYKSCKRVGKPIFNSAISTIIGISLLGFSKSYIFMSFFKTLFILMCLGLLNSLLFLPVLLSIIGPHWPRHKAHKNKIIENHLNNNTEGIKINNECAPKAQIEELLN